MRPWLSPPCATRVLTSLVGGRNASRAGTSVIIGASHACHRSRARLTRACAASTKACTGSRSSRIISPARSVEARRNASSAAHDLAVRNVPLSTQPCIYNEPPEARNAMIVLIPTAKVQRFKFSSKGTALSADWLSSMSGHAPTQRRDLRRLPVSPLHNVGEQTLQGAHRQDHGRPAVWRSSAYTHAGTRSSHGPAPAGSHVQKAEPQIRRRCAVAGAGVLYAGELGTNWIDSSSHWPPATSA